MIKKISFPSEGHDHCIFCGTLASRYYFNTIHACEYFATCSIHGNHYSKEIQYGEYLIGRIMES